MREPYLVLLAPAAEAAFCALPAQARRTLGEVMRGVAEIAEFLEPVHPRWLGLPGQRPPLLRVAAGGIELVYTLDAKARTVSVRGVQRERPERLPPLAGERRAP